MFWKMYFFYILVLCFYYSVTCDQRGTRVKRIVGGLPADVPPFDEPVVYTRFGGRAARVEGVREFPHYVFRGIKYAHPPIGKERFLRPRQKFLEGEVNATSFAPPCIQPRPGTDQVIGSEDCLALNIITPELPTGQEGIPVVVWIHGGGFRYGSASQYGVRHLVRKRLVVVTIQYRLGSLGFLSSGGKQLPGNVALWDMVLAVQWVRNYIGFFGGNPLKIVVMGHGTGASSALLVALSKVAKGMSSGVVAMSGTAVSNWAIDHTPQDTAADIARQNGCPTASTVTMVKCLQYLPPESIIRGDSHIEFQRLHSRGFMSGLSGRLGSAPVSEGYHDGRSLPGVVEDEPINDLNKGKNPKIPLFTGITKDETKRAVQGPLREDIEYKLNTVDKFLDNVLVKNLRSLLASDKLIVGISNGTHGSPLLPLNFANYLQSKTQTLHDVLNKVAEATGDALFNLPAFLTCNQWSKNGAPTFLYSFEHSGKRPKGDSFLRGVPIIGNKTTNQGINDTTVSHGDDLAYLFEVNDVEGNSIETEEALNEDDKKVRDIFTQIISDFAHHGKVLINGREVESFSSEKNNFIQITAKPVVANNFRVCEMALWSGLAQTLKSEACSFLDAFNLKGLVDALPLPGILNNTILSNISGKKPDVSNILPISPIVPKTPLGILGGRNVNKNTTNKPKPSLLGGFLG